MSACAEEKLITHAAADKLLGAHDGDVALLYIYYKRHGCIDAETAAATLCRTMSEIRDAQEKLERMGLLNEDAAKKTVLLPPPLPVRENRPQYTSQEISRYAMEDPAFKDILDEAARVMGYQLGKSEMNILLGIHRNLGLPHEVMLMLINYCDQINREKYRGQRKLTALFIEFTAYNWARDEIITVEQAEEHIRKEEIRRTDSARVAAALGIRDRQPSKTEAEYIGKWLDMGFDEPEIMLAYDRTIMKTGKLTFNYLDAILGSWKSAGLTDIKEIEEKDPPKRKGDSHRGRSTDRAQNVDLDELQKSIDRMLGGK